MIARSIRYISTVWQRQMRPLAALLAILFYTIVPHIAHAETQEFTILAVGIDSNEDKAAAAALSYARQRAIYIATRKLGVTNPSQQAARIPAAAVAQIIRGATVLQSRRIGDKTYLEVSVTIVTEALNKALNITDIPTGNNANFNNATTRSVLLLPALVTPKSTLVWGDDNLLWEPLSVELVRQGHGTVILPGGDLQDLRLVDGDNVAKVRQDELKPMFERYGVKEIIIAILTPGNGGEPSHVLLRRLSDFHPPEEELEVKSSTIDDNMATRVERAAQSIATASVQIATSTTASEQEKLKTATKIPVRFNYTLPKELGRMTEAVRSAPGVLLLELPAITLNNVDGTIYVDGDQTTLRKTLATRGIIIRGKDDQWVISVR